MRFDLIDLRLFVHIAETSSITRGADRAHLSLASASARIRGMEAALGVPLLERRPRGVTATPAGQAVLRHAQAILQQHERMRGELGSFARGLKGFVKLLSNTIAATEFLPKALAIFLSAHPNIDIELEERNSGEIVSAVSEGYADAGILVDPGYCGDLQLFEFQTDRLVLIAQRGSSILRARRLSFRDALDQEFVGLTAGRALQDFLVRQAARAGQPLRVRVRMTSFDAICQMVELGVGIAIIPEVAARKYRKGALEIAGLADEWAIRRLSICCRQHNDLSEHARRLIDHLRASGSAPPS